MSLWYGAQAKVKIDDAIEDIDPNIPLHEQLTEEKVNYSSEIQDATFSPGEADVSALNTFSHQHKEESRPEVRTVDFTFALESEQIMTEHHKTGLQQVGEIDWFRLFCDEWTGDRYDRAILFELEDGNGNRVNILMNHAWFTSGGSTEQDADGVTELSITAACLVKDFYAEDNIEDYTPAIVTESVSSYSEEALSETGSEINE